MATVGDTIGIKRTVTSTIVQRWNTVKFVFTGDTSLATVHLYDDDGYLLSTMTGVSSNVEYSIVTGEAIDTDFAYPLPPAPVGSIDVIPDGPDIVNADVVITDILTGLRVMQANRILLMELKDVRIRPSKYTERVVAGDPSIWFRNDEDFYLENAIYVPDDAIITAEYIDRGAYIPLIGRFQKESKIQIGILNQDVFTSYRGRP